MVPCSECGRSMRDTGRSRCRDCGEPYCLDCRALKRHDCNGSGDGDVHTGFDGTASETRATTNAADPDVDANRSQASDGADESSTGFGRRSVLVGVGTGIGVLLGGGYLVRSVDRDRLSASSDGTATDLSPLDLRALEWEGTTLAITFAPENPWDGWTIAHEDDDPVEETLVSGSVPDAGASIELPMERLINQDSTPEYPSRYFRFSLFDGNFTAWDEGPTVAIATRHGPSTTLTVPPSVLPDYRVAES